MKNFKKKLSMTVMSCLVASSFMSYGNTATALTTNTPENIKLVNVKPTEKTGAPKLEKLNWASENHAALQNLIDTNGINSANYDANHKPYAVFDWDNTTIINDVEEALLIYQLKNLEFKMTPKEFGQIIRKNVPTSNFVKACNNKNGKPVNITLIAQDIEKDYSYLYANYKGLKGKTPLNKIQNTLQYKDFVAKTRYLYEAIGESFSPDVSYPWVTYMFTGMTKAQVQNLTEKSNDFWLKHKLGEETLISPKECSGKAGVVSVTYKTGLRTIPEQQNLYKTLMDNGIEVYVCSASFIDVVKTFASNPKYGYNLSEKNVFAMELEKDAKGVIKGEFNKAYDQTQNKGKSLTIGRFLVSKHGQGPILIAGDSSGDVAMMKDFKDTKLAIIVNRCKGSDLGELSKQAAETIGKPEAKYLLQGRDENLGVFVPSQKSIFLGSTEGKLLK